MKPIKTALVAYGMSGQVFHAPFLDALPQFELSVIMERTKNLSRARYPKVKVVRTFEELLDEDIELVVVNSPDSTHYEYARRALEKGLNVIVEKPVSVSYGEAENLVRLAREKGLMLSVYQNRRWDSDFLTVRKVLESGQLGKVVEFESCYPRYRDFVRKCTWKETGEMGGGLLLNLGSHVIDQAVQLFGMPEKVYADIATLRDGGIVEDYFRIHMIAPEKDPGLHLVVKSSYLMAYAEPRFLIHGRKGSFVKFGSDVQEADLTSGKKPSEEGWGVEPEEIWGEIVTDDSGHKNRVRFPSQKGCYQELYLNIYDHLRNKKPLLTDASGVLGVMKVIEAARESARKRQVIPVI